MPAMSANASAKLILLGEHAVVYGEPALAMPFSALRVRVVVEPWIGAPAGRIHVFARDLDLDQDWRDLPENNLVREAIVLVLSVLEIQQTPTCKISIFSEIPVSAGLGASAAITVAIMRAFSAFLGHPLQQDQLNQLAFQVETRMHGTPSGIDNTVIVYEKPIYFRKGFEIEFLKPGQEFTFLVADSGVKKSTASTVAQLANDRLQNPSYYDPLIEQIGECARVGRSALESGNAVVLGEAMNTNQDLLATMQLSCPELDQLVQAARQSGALGAKLTGGGKGGHMLALVREEDLDAVRSALLGTGTRQVYQTTLLAEGNA
ncbi:MAG: mevalonate kinase [Anaerolineaceae bacterium]